MLVFVVVLSVILLAGAFIAVRADPHPVRWGVFLAFAAATVALPIAIELFPTVVGLLAILLAISLRIWPSVRYRVRSFAPLALGSTVIAYGIACLIALGGSHRLDDLRAKYPYESMEDRLPVPSPLIGGRPPEMTGDAPTTQIEQLINEYHSGTRTQMLRQLHERQVQQFVNSPGFGVARILIPSEWGLRLHARGEVPAQPGPPFSPTPGPLTSATDDTDLRNLHDVGVLNFVNPSAFGYFKDRRHVAGFASHAFSEIPGPVRQWKVERLDLVGLLLNAEPVAYVSDRLPAMDELRGAPTRMLDQFEAEGLGAVRNGEAIYVRSDGSQTRMLGAIRSARQCVACHGGERGDLLGAFSYTLQATAEKP